MASSAARPAITALSKAIGNAAPAASLAPSIREGSPGLTPRAAVSVERVHHLRHSLADSGRLLVEKSLASGELAEFLKKFGPVYFGDHTS